MNMHGKIEAQFLQDKVVVTLTGGNVGITFWRGCTWFVYLSDTFVVTHAFRF